MANTRAGANSKGAQAYSVIIPGNKTIQTRTGGSGYNTVPVSGPHNYGFSVAGPADPASVTASGCFEHCRAYRYRGSYEPARSCRRVRL